MSRVGGWGVEFRLLLPHVPTFCVHLKNTYGEPFIQPKIRSVRKSGEQGRINQAIDSIFFVCNLNRYLFSTQNISKTDSFIYTRMNKCTFRVWCSWKENNSKSSSSSVSPLMPNRKIIEFAIASLITCPPALLQAVQK